MKVSVCCEIVYSYEVEVPDDEEDCAPTDLETYCDLCDPVYGEICGTMADAHVNFTGRLVSIVDSDTDEVYYTN